MLMISADLDLQCGSGDGSPNGGAPTSSPEYEDPTDTWEADPKDTPEHPAQNNGWQEAPRGSSNQGSSTQSFSSWDDLIAWLQNYRATGQA